jgi:hypothetical protein
MKNIILFVAILLPLHTSAFGVGVAEVTEVISVVRIGVSLVEYIYKVFSSILVMVIQLRMVKKFKESFLNYLFLLYPQTFLPPGPGR